MKLRLALVLTFFAVGCRDLLVPEPPPTTAFLTGRVIAAVPGTAVNSPVGGVSVSLLNTNITGTTNERGIFVLGPLPAGTFRVFFSTRSRQRIVTDVNVRLGATNNMGDVSLQENALLTGRALIQGRTNGNVGITVFSPGTDYVTTCADNGGWLLGNLPEGAIRATAWRPGFSPATTTDINLQGGVVTSAVDLILEPELASAPPGSIVGSVIVVGADDNAGVTVKATSRAGEVRSSVTSAADGTFTLANLTSDLYVVTLELSGFPSARIPNLAVAGGVQLELEPVVMAPAGDNNTGKGEPIGGPSGPLFSLDGGITSPDGGTVTTDDGGTIGAECTDDNECGSGRLCINNRCVGCSVNVQCRPGYSCQGGDCIRDCVDNAECPSGLACIAGSCVGCITTSDCRSGALVCNAQSRCAHCASRAECPTGLACLPAGCGACTADGECGAGAICEQGVCTPGDCHGNADCSPAQACIARNCSACTVDSQCRLGQLCVGGACATGDCRDVTTCAAGQVCLMNNCGACANDQQCGTGSLCLSGTNGFRCTPAECRVTSDCNGPSSAGMVCANNQCVPCSSTNSCPSGAFCNSSNRCATGNCNSLTDCTGSRAGFACIGNNCLNCGANSDCGASGFVCDVGICRPGNCLNAAACMTGQRCVNFACVGCSTSAECGAGRVCGSDNLCHSGTCATTADCTGGRLCDSNYQCVACTADAQCGAGKICFGGACVTGTCHGDADCSAGTQLCNPTTHVCQACAPTSQLNSTQCGGGRLCDATGFCRIGNCFSNTNCTGGQACVNNSCTGCTLDSQCSAGQLCVGNLCRTGNCHGVAPDPNVDCAATNGVCVSNVCTGNCRTNTDCPSTGLCNATTHACSSCTGSGQCGAGRVCNGSACVVGQCSALETNCNVGEACINNTCILVGPNTALDGGGYIEPAGAVAGGSRSPMVLSGRDTLYYSAPIGAGGTWSVALEPNLTLRWRVRDTTLGNIKGGYAGAGIVLPAPGFPHDELFLTNDGNSGAIAHRADNGSTVWTIGAGAQSFSTGLVNGVPHVSWMTLSSNALNLMKTDGTGMRSVTLNTCGAALNPPAVTWGTKAIYVLCSDAVTLIDPVSLTIKQVPHPSSLSPSGQFSPHFAVWRPQDNVVVRGVNSGTVTSDIIVYFGRGAAGTLAAIRVPDDWLTNPASTATYPMWNAAFGTNNFLGAITIDSTAAVIVELSNAFYKFNLFTGAQLAAAPVGGYTDYWTLVSNDQFVGIGTSQLHGFQVVDGATAAPIPLWTLPASPGNYLTLHPTVQKNATASGNLLVWQNNATGQQVLRSLAPAPDAGSFLTSPPVWTLGGDMANHNAAPGWQCSTNAQCASNETCILGKCAGTCRTAAQCPAGQGCVLAQCGACNSAAVCRTSEVCFAASCIACAGAGCCSTTADCSPGSYCQAGNCRVQPASGTSGAFSLPNLITRSNLSSAISVAPDGTMYVGDLNGTQNASWKIVSPAGTLLSTTPVLPTPVGGQGQQPILMVASTGAGNALFNGSTTNIYSAPASSSVASWTTASYPSLGLQFLRLAQGMSSALGTARPTLYATMITTGGGNTSIIAIDSAGAAAGGGTNPGLLWAASTGGTCLAGGVSALDHLLIGSDGTVYVVCPDSSVEAWAADGDPTSGAPPNRSGLMKWRSGVIPGFPTMQGQPVIGKSAAGDILYLPRANGVGLGLLNVSTAVNGTVPTVVAVESGGPLLTDSTGRAIAFAGSGAPREFSIVSPTGTIVFSEKTKWAPDGHGPVLTADNVVVFSDVSSTSLRVTGVSIASSSLGYQLFTVTPPGNQNIDSFTGIVVLPTTQVPGGLIAFDHIPTTGSFHTFSGMPWANTAGPMPNAWSTLFGDQQRRSSLKTQ